MLCRCMLCPIVEAGLNHNEAAGIEISSSSEMNCLPLVGHKEWAASLFLEDCRALSV